MELNKELSESKFIENILKAIQNIASGIYSERVQISNKYDNLDAIATGINMLAEEIKAYHIEKDEQAEALLNILEDVNVTKEELKKSEEKYRLLAENVTDVIWTMDLDMNFTYYSSSIENQRGYSVEEALNLSLEESITPESLKKVFTAFEEEFAIEEQPDKDLNRSRSIELEMYSKDGTTIWTEVTATFLRDDSGKAIGIQGLTRDITERKKAEEELQKLASVVKHSGELVNLATLEGKMIFLNEAGSKMLGIDPSEVEEHQILEVIPQNYLELVNNELLPKLMTEGFWEGDLQYRNIKTDGVTDVHAQCFTINDPDSGKPLFLANVSLNITDRKRSEEAVRESEENYRNLYESSPESITILDIEGNIIDVNNSTVKITGYSKDELLNKSFLELGTLSEEKLDEYADIFSKLLSGEKVEPLFVEIKNKNGEMRHIEVYPSTISKNNVISKIQLLSRDITERKIAEEKLLKSEENYRSLFNSSRDAIMTLNPPSWIFTSGNPATIELFNAKDESEFTSKGPWDVSPEFQPDGQTSTNKAKKMIEKAMNQGSNYFEWTHKRLGGSDFPATVLLTRVEVEEGKPFLQATVRDITERKTAEEELNKVMGELERSNIELEQFAYVASHDLQEPLRMISGYVQLLAKRYEGKLDSGADEFINFAVDGAKRMQKLINDLLKYSRVNTRGKEPIDANSEEILNHVLTDLGMMIEDSGANITRDPLPLIKADDIQLGQVFQNLVSNAIKFHGEEPPKVHVSAEKNGDEWLFKIQDNGVGIDPKFQERAFMVFQRENPHGEIPGTGIGLAVVKRIVERHKGRIWFESESGKGTTFYFTIPNFKGDDK